MPRKNRVTKKDEPGRSSFSFEYGFEIIHESLARTGAKRIAFLQIVGVEIGARLVGRVEDAKGSFAVVTSRQGQ